MNYIDREGYLHWSNELNVSAILRLLRGPNLFGETHYVYVPNQIVLEEFSELQFDCLNCAEYLMSAYADKYFEENRVNSKIVGTLLKIGKTNPGNMDAVIRYKGTNNRDVDPDVGQAYFICRTDLSDDGMAAAEREDADLVYYHAAFVIAKSDVCNFTLETFDNIGWNFCSYNRPALGGETFHNHWANQSCFKDKNVKTVAIELIQ